MFDRGTSKPGWREGAGLSRIADKLTADKVRRGSWVVALAAVATALLKLPIETIGTQFGGIPRSLPMPGLPDIGLEKIQAVLPNAISFALLGNSGIYAPVVARIGTRIGTLKIAATRFEKAR